MSGKNETTRPIAVNLELEDIESMYESTAQTRLYIEELESQLQQANEKIKELEGDSNNPKCEHRGEITTRWDYVKCNDCGSVLTDSSWGVASRMWFKSLNEAKFYKKNGFLPKGSE